MHHPSLTAEIYPAQYGISSEWWKLYKLLKKCCVNFDLFVDSQHQMFIRWHFGKDLALQTGSVRNGGFKFAAHKKLPLPTEDENDSQTVLGSSGLPRKILHGEAGDDEDEETEKLRYRLAKVAVRAFCSAQNFIHRKNGVKVLSCWSSSLKKTITKDYVVKKRLANSRQYTVKLVWK